jgi:hypothetical protein
MFTRVKKMLTKKCSQHYRKILMKEYWQQLKKY